LKRVKDLWETYRERAPVPLVSLLYDKAPEEQELDVFDQIAQKLGKYTRPASQDEYQDYCNGELYDIRKMLALK
jgi:hypothetical protein